MVSTLASGSLCPMREADVLVLGLWLKITVGPRKRARFPFTCTDEVCTTKL